MIAQRLITLADRFWSSAGGRSHPPYDIAAVASIVLPVTVSAIADLTLFRAEFSLQRRGLAVPISPTDRPLHGCVIALRGHGFIFVNAGDTEDERRFTVAHEIAHFLLDHESTRTDAVRRHGADILPVLDGRREPTTTERLHAALLGDTFAVESHFLERHGALGLRAAEAETDADRLALELLAPSRDVRSLIKQSGTQSALDVVVSCYGLPVTIAQSYVQSLARAIEPPTFVEWLVGARPATSQ